MLHRCMHQGPWETARRVVSITQTCSQTSHGCHMHTTWPEAWTREHVSVATVVRRAREETNR